MYKMNVKSYKINPVVLKYKMVQLNILEKDNNINLEFNAGTYSIQTQYNPCADNKGNCLTLKVEYGAMDRQKYDAPGFETCFNINSDLNLYVAMAENETGITLEVYSGYYPMFIEHQNKTTVLEKCAGLSNKIVQQNIVKMRLVNPIIE